MVSLKPITNGNLEEVLVLRVAEGKENFVHFTEESLAQVYVYKEKDYDTLRKRKRIVAVSSEKL